MQVSHLAEVTWGHLPPDSPGCPQCSLQSSVLGEERSLWTLTCRWRGD